MREHVNFNELRSCVVHGVGVVVEVHVDLIGFFIGSRPGRCVEIRRIRVDPRTIGMHDGPLMDADSADLRG